MYQYTKLKKRLELEGFFKDKLRLQQNSIKSIFV